MAVTTSQWKATQPARLPVRWRKRPRKRLPRVRAQSSAVPDVLWSEGEQIAVGDDEERQRYSDRRRLPDGGKSPGQDGGPDSRARFWIADGRLQSHDLCSL